jgi:hypothetical protein
MPKFAISAAMMAALVALSASVPANAELNHGPRQRNDGKCFVYSRFEQIGPATGWGYWGDCEKQREAGCSDAGLTKFGYFGSCDAKQASAKNNARRRPAAGSR